MPSVAAISQQIWDMKYRLKGADGAPLDRTIEDTWRRVATALAEPEADPALWTERFLEALADFRFLPAGRVVAGAGTRRNVTLFNCFVMGTIADDMKAIFTHLREAALTMQQGGGIGYDFSTLRPKGAPVKGVGADASGPLSFMDVWDAMCRTIMSAGYRRGAMMATLRCDHPDIEAFIEAKRAPGRLRMFNLSVLATDAFMQAVKEDAPWELTFGGTHYKTLPARELWDKIMRATYAYAEPGVIFIDRINRRNNLYYAETIAATNPCVTADTWVQTEEGPRQVAELIGKPFTAIVDGRPFASSPRGFFRTGSKPVLRVTTEEGHGLRLTADHPVLVVSELTRWRRETEWRAAGTLKPGDKVVLHDHGAGLEWPSAENREFAARPPHPFPLPRWGEGEDRSNSPDETRLVGYRVGRRFGDGPGFKVQPQANWGSIPRWGEGEDRSNSPDETRLVGYRVGRRFGDGPGFKVQPRANWGCAVEGNLAVAQPGVINPSLDGRAQRAEVKLGLIAGERRITAELERASSDFSRGFLAGLFDARGEIAEDVDGNPRVRIAQGDFPRLQAIQRMLMRLGVRSAIGGARSSAMNSSSCELTIAGESLRRFATNVLEDVAEIGHPREMNRISLFAALSRRRVHTFERFTACVAEVIGDGEEDVFDVEIPGINAFDANGFYVHNCGEQPLPPYGACLLGSINLAALVLDPFTAEARLDMSRLEQLVPLAVRMLDNAVEVSGFPLEAQTAEAHAKRRIGLGVTGLADALILCNVRYGSGDAVKLTEAWLKAIQRRAYLASTELAREKGAFPLFDREKYLAGETVAALDADVREAIAEHGIRNALLTSVAPTGTISIFADNVSSGLEPVFSFHYTRNVLMPDGSRKEEEVADYAYRLYRRLKGDPSTGSGAPLTEAFVDVQALSPSDHVVMQAAVQKYVDSSISKTINVPADFPFEKFKDVYLQAYELGCKGCTTYRPNEVTGAVLEARQEKAVSREPELPLPAPAPKSQDVYEAGGVVYMTQPLSRPEALPGRTYKIRWPAADHAIYITVNDIIQDGRRRPFEIFINSKSMEHYAWTVGLTRMISAVFRRGGDVAFVVEELKAVFDPRGGAWMEGRYVPSLLAAIGDVIERHMVDIGFMPPKERREPAALAEVRAVANLPGSQARMAQCPKCGEAALIRIENCDQCTSCDYSKCG